MTLFKIPVLCFILFLFGCQREISFQTGEVQTTDEILSFGFMRKNNPGKLLSDITCSIQNDTISGILPCLECSKDSLTASFSVPPGVTVSIGNEVQVSDSTINNFSKPLIFTVKNKFLKERKYFVYIKRFTGLPIIYINTENRSPIKSKEIYVNAQIKIESNEIGFSDYSDSTEIRGRGNSTWNMPKKPFRLKLKTKSELLGMPADKDWALLANYSDKTLMRNQLAFITSTFFEMPYTPRSKFVEVILNGEYLGNYLLTEHLKIGENRINITSMKKKDIEGEDATGGYRIEVERRLDEPNWFVTKKGVPIIIKDPDAGVPEQNEYISNYIQLLENALFSNEFTNIELGYTKYIDTETFINWYWVNEIFKNNDAVFYSSVQMYKDRSKPLCLGPVWDFDIAGGNINYNGNDKADGWWVKTSTWMKRLFEDSSFAKKAVLRWKTIRPKLSTLQEIIEEKSANLELSQKANFERWDILNQYVWPNAVVTGSYEKEVLYLKNWLAQRIEWIDANIHEISQ